MPRCGGGARNDLAVDHVLAGVHPNETLVRDFYEVQGRYLARARSLLRESRAAHAAFPDVIRGSGGSYDGIPGFGVSREAR